MYIHGHIYSHLFTSNKILHIIRYIFIYMYLTYNIEIFHTFNTFKQSFYTLTKPFLVIWNSFVCVILKFPLMNEIYHSLSNIISSSFYPVLYKYKGCQRFQFWWKMTWNCLGGTDFFLRLFFFNSKVVLSHVRAIERGRKSTL